MAKQATYFCVIAIPRIVSMSTYFYYSSVDKHQNNHCNRSVPHWQIGTTCHPWAVILTDQHQRQIISRRKNSQFVCFSFLWHMQCKKDRNMEKSFVFSSYLLVQISVGVLFTVCQISQTTAVQIVYENGKQMSFNFIHI